MANAGGHLVTVFFECSEGEELFKANRDADGVGIEGRAGSCSGAALERNCVYVFSSPVNNNVGRLASIAEDVALILVEEEGRVAFFWAVFCCVVGSDVVSLHLLPGVAARVWLLLCLGAFEVGTSVSSCFSYLYFSPRCTCSALN